MTHKRARYSATLLHHLHALFFAHTGYVPLTFLVCTIDCLLTASIIRFVPYTEIDFQTYLQQAQLFLDGERTYTYIDPPNGTGPCVYPAGHLYAYAILDHLTDHGAYLLPAQVTFGILYISTLFLVSQLYRLAKAPPILVLFLALSKRLHSIYLLRLFNDPLSIFFMYLCMYLLCCRRWKAACISYSLALSIKMNALLYLPGLLVILFRAIGATSTMVHVGVIVGGVQGILGLPFILRDPQAYISNAFDFSRMFLFKWTVNWRFLGEKVFSHPATSKVLLGLHVFILCVFGVHQWTNISKEGWKWVSSRWKGDSHPMSASFIVRVLCTSNLIGMTFARSLHYQFYSWYAFQLPLLAWSTTWSPPLRYVPRLTNKCSIAIPVIIEWSWNVFPSTTLSSISLFLAHTMLLIGLWTRRARTPMHIS